MRLIFIFMLSHILVTLASIKNVLHDRTEMFNKELAMMLGSDIELTDKEMKANNIIMDLKIQELERGFWNPRDYNLSKHFFEYKDYVKNTTLYQLMKKMPKGAILHAHDTGLLGPDYTVGLTYWENLYVCFSGDDVNFLFSNTIPNTTCGTTWQLMRDARYSSGNIQKFDANLRRYFTMVVDNPEKAYPDTNTAWAKFQGLFTYITPLISYKPVWEQYFYDTLKAFREDGAVFMEIRSELPQLYDLNGNIFDLVVTAESYKTVVDQFKIDYPDFFGAKLIYAPFRLVSNETIKVYLETTREINRKLPGFLAGFDLVGQEDLGKPLKIFLPELVEVRKEFNLFFHAGETNWNGLSTDENLFDAIALGTKRIGHGYGIMKHPVLVDEVKKRDIALEVNVISNNVLKLVADIRNHPLASMLALGLPVVLSSDDPGFWEADPMTHDAYVAFVGVANRHADLRLLKKLILNTFRYSTYPDLAEIVHDFEIRWTKFIDFVVRESIDIKFRACTIL